MELHRRSCAVIFVALFCLIVAACGSQPVVYFWQPVTNEALVTATHALALAEKVLATMPPLLVDGHRRGVVPLAVLKEYDSKGRPAVQAALNLARDALAAYAREPNLEQMNAVRVALQLVQGVVSEGLMLMTHYLGDMQ